MFDAPAKRSIAVLTTDFAFNLMRSHSRFKWRLPKVTAFTLASALILQGCANDSNVEYGVAGYVRGFYGGVVADEPNAALIGRDILTSGGNAADAAVAMSFALSVSYPSAISLGGGGVCIVHDGTIGVTEVIDFIPPAGTGMGGDRPSAVPTLTRGMAALHARYGQFPWAGVVSPAERMARLGHRVSRALAVEMSRAAEPLYGEPAALAIFAPNGRLVGEGDQLSQPELGSVLGQIRAGGAGAFYNGALARRVVDGVAQAGGTLTYEELRDYSPTWRLPLIIPFGDDELNLAPPPAAAGPMLGVMWRMLIEDDRYADAASEERAHLLAEVMKRASADRKTWLGEGYSSTMPLEDVLNPDRVAGLMANYSPTKATPGIELDPQNRQLAEVISGTGFVTVDRNGMAVACDLTLYNPFGTGRVAPGTGILLAAAPGLRGRNPLSLSPAMVINTGTLTFRFGLASSGGPLGPASEIQIMADTLLTEKPLDAALAEPRFLAVDVPDAVLVEKEGGDELAASLKAKGHPVSRLSWPGLATAIHCPSGITRSSSRSALCRVVHDPRGYGLSSFSDERGG
ncbi:MAG: gamma-glutamyltransferase [Alphaproteobacteria bacterium]|nr:gamma-glutamyltransferase [Alphaproteobacteria bacterium]